MSSADSLVPRTNPAVKSGTTTDCADGLYVTVHVQGMPVDFLVDTGANITIVKSSVWERIPQFKRPMLEDVEVKMILANGGCAPFVGRGVFTLRVADQEAEHRTWVSNIQLDGILGLDFLKNHGCEPINENGGYKLTVRDTDSKIQTHPATCPQIHALCLPRGH